MNPIRKKKVIAKAKHIDRELNTISDSLKTLVEFHVIGPDDATEYLDFLCNGFHIWLLSRLPLSDIEELMEELLERDSQ